jgi:cysteine-rich repeat protein
MTNTTESQVSPGRRVYLSPPSWLGWCLLAFGSWGCDELSKLNALQDAGFDASVEAGPVVTNKPPKPKCGNGLEEKGEQCDDANDDPFDGCDACKQVPPWIAQLTVMRGRKIPSALYSAGM